MGPSMGPSAFGGFDSVDRSMNFSRLGQKDAQGSVSPLRVRIKRVWALRARLAAVFGGSLIRNPQIFKLTTLKHFWVS